jgi:hypothetical protein
MTQLIAYYLVIILALATFVVWSAGMVYAGMRLQRMLARRAQMQRLAALKAYAGRAKVVQPTPSDEVRRRAQA